ncbi:hypothetical protein JMJ77_0008894, partial [Colletotrichum scovillei]
NSLTDLFCIPGKRSSLFESPCKAGAETVSPSLAKFSAALIEGGCF